MKHKTYLRIFRNLRYQLLTFALFSLLLLILRQIFVYQWLVLAFDICVLYCAILFVVMIAIWWFDKSD